MVWVENFSTSEPKAPYDLYHIYGQKDTPKAFIDTKNYTKNKSNCEKELKKLKKLKDCVMPGPEDWSQCQIHAVTTAI